MPSPLSSTAPSRGEEGYNLVILMVLVTVMNIMVAAALPSWVQVVKRDKEAELIFRGMQYAEAIRVFQQRHGRLPIRLEELIEVEPRSIRQLFPDPMSEHGNWGLLIQAAQPAGRGGGQGQPGAARPAGQGQNPTSQTSAPESPSPAANSQNSVGQQPPRGVGFQGDRRQRQRTGGNMVAVPPSDEQESFGRPTQRTTGPIVGVYSATDGESLRTFAGQNNYNQWQFHLGLIPTPVMLGGDNPAPRVHSNWVGKPFRSDLEVKQPGSAGNRGRDATGAGRPDESLRPSRFRPNSRRP